MRSLPGLQKQEQDCADSAAALKLLRTGFGRLACLPSRAKGQLASPLRGALGSTARRGDCSDGPEPLPAAGSPTRPPELPVASSCTIASCWLKSSISLAKGQGTPNPHMGVHAGKKHGAA